MQKTFALFDFDGTLCPGDSLIPFCLYAFRHGRCSLPRLLCGGLAGIGYGLRLVSARQSKQAALGFLKGMTVAEADALAQSFCRDKLLPRLYPEGMQAVKDHHNARQRALLVSASPELYLKFLREKLPLDGIVATRLHVDETGRYTGQIAGENCRGVEKPLRLAEYLAARGEEIDYASSSAYGDSAGDAPMMELCARKVAINPKRKLMKRLCHSDGVTVLRWR